MTYICISNLTIIGSDNGLLPRQHHAIIWTNAGILLIQTLGTNFSQILNEIHTFSFKKIHFKMLSGKWMKILDENDVEKKKWKKKKLKKKLKKKRNQCVVPLEFTYGQFNRKYSQYKLLNLECKLHIWKIGVMFSRGQWVNFSWQYLDDVPLVHVLIPSWAHFTNNFLSKFKLHEKLIFSFPNPIKVNTTK